MEERRRFVRLDARLEVNYHIIGQAGKDLPSLTRNVGGGGIGFFTESRLAPGTILEVEVEFPTHQRRVRFTGGVIWSGQLLLSSGDKSPRPFETGVRFIDIALEDREFLLHYSRGNVAPTPPSGKGRAA